MNQPVFLSNLASLRGLVAVLVVLVHAHGLLLPLMDTTQTAFMTTSHILVDFFFILSGFILSHVYGHRFQHAFTRLTYKRYMQARFARIYPLHLFTLIWALIPVLHIMSTKGLPEEARANYDPRSIPTSLLLIPASPWHEFYPPNGPSWSLATEWWVYFIFPLLVPVVFRLKRMGKLIMLLLILGLYACIMYYLVPTFSSSAHSGEGMINTLDISGDFSLLRCLAGFCLGMLVYELYRQQWGRRWLKSSWVLALVGVGMFIAMHLGMHSIALILVAALLILSASYNTGYVHRVLSSKPLQRLGDWSYSIYMIHAPLILTYYAAMLWANPDLVNQSEEAAGTPDYVFGWIGDGIFVLITLLLSSLTYRFIELPARTFLNARFHIQRAEPVNVGM
ncbi:acyltransferase [Spirosoma sp. KNUC1025]|uniref:acyltransferase family protein n=1 Tax=Spirosoma sp. KNUC1025 TaxID=2894082 RepID=UPI003864BBA8|nr:acyltransferase [Spirosoma sp. KNUC1025]